MRAELKILLFAVSLFYFNPEILGQQNNVSGVNVTPTRPLNELPQPGKDQPKADLTFAPHDLPDGTFQPAGEATVYVDQTVIIDGVKEGRKFDGIGAVSGGGATSRFLMEYPEPQRSQILDYLFKPKFGASFQTLYIEIGGDGNATQGAEPSHARTLDEFLNPKPEYYQRGYEWWLMKEARKRNPDIVFDVCAWRNPSWTRGGFWTQDMCDYYVQWLKGAKKYHNLDVKYIGCKNEGGTNIPFVKMLRSTLDKAGLTNVTIHAFDNWRPETKWIFAQDFATDQELNNAVGIVGNHVTWKGAPENGAGKYVPIPDYVLNSGKRIWDTEEHTYSDGFPSALLKVIACNNNYIDSKITSTTFWHLASAFYPVEGWYGKHAAIQAPSPWNGNYTVVPELWGHAHTGQFTKIGWKYLDGQGCGYMTGKGSYVTYKSTNGKDFSIVIETKGATANQNIAYNITGGLSTGKVHVWRSNASTQFEKLSDITPVNGSFTMTVEPNSIYTITTTTGQQKGAHPAPPAAQPFPFPYYENYDHYKKTGVLPYYLSDIDGIIEVVNRPDGKGKCAREVVTKKSSGSNYFSIIGDVNWKDYEVSIDFSIEGTGAAILYGRLNSTRAASIPKSYWLQVNNTGEWGFYMGAAQITSGTVSLAAQPWHNMKLVFQGTTIKGLVNNSQVFSITDAGFSNGMTGLGAGINSIVLFDNLIVNAIDGPKPKPTVFFQDTQSY